jgi:hypothetical protein
LGKKNQLQHQTLSYAATVPLGLGPLRKGGEAASMLQQVVQNVVAVLLGAVAVAVVNSSPLPNQVHNPPHSRSKFLGHRLAFLRTRCPN